MIWMLVALFGEKANKRLLHLAFQKTPSLIIDCGNCANPHALRVRERQLHEVYVMNAEAIYRFREALRQAPAWIRKLNIQCVLITTIHALFSYDNEEENEKIIRHCWQKMKEFPVPVYIAVNPMHPNYAKDFADRIINKYHNI